MWSEDGHRKAHQPTALHPGFSQRSGAMGTTSPLRGLQAMTVSTQQGCPGVSPGGNSLSQTKAASCLAVDATLGSREVRENWHDGPLIKAVRRLNPACLRGSLHPLVLWS